jgi:uracil permease
MKYGIKDKPPFGQLVLFSLQMMLSCFTATALIGQICNVPLSGAFVGSGLATIVYLIATKFESSMYISNSGAFVSPVLIALQLGGATAVAIGGAIACIVYCIFGFIFMKIDVSHIYKVLPKVLIGSITVVIGITLMSFIPSYIGDTGNVGMFIALITVLTIAFVSHYCKGALALFPFLIGTLVGYVVSIPFGLVDFSVFEGISLFTLPDLGFFHWTNIDVSTLPNIIVLFVAFTVSAICECLSDHAVLGNIIGVDLYRKPGLGRIFIGEGLANLVGASSGQLAQCSYGESVSTIGFSKCSSVYSTLGCALFMIALGFIEPVQAFVASIPSCVIGGGTAMVLYGFIANSGIRTLQSVDFNNQKNLIISSVVMSLGISGVIVGNDTFHLSGTALALIAGIILNFVLKEKNN